MANRHTHETASSNTVIWVPSCNGEILDLLDLESLNNCQEARDAFPQEVLDTAGYPVAYWRYGAPIGLRTINEKNTISKSEQLMGFQYQCHKVNDKYKDHSGHVVTSDLSIIPNGDLIRTSSEGPSTDHTPMRSSTKTAKTHHVRILGTQRSY